MKIVIIQGAFLPIPPHLGGAIEKRWFAIGKEFVKNGHEVLHISKKFKNLADDEIIDGVKHVRVKSFSTPRSGIILKIYDLIYSFRACKMVTNDADMIITNTFWSPLLLSKNQLKKVMVDIARIPKGQIRFYTKAKILRANSKIVGKLIEKEISVKYHHKVKVIPNPLPFEIKDSIELESKSNVILYTGRVHPEKGLELLIRAFSSLNSDWQLKIVGPWDIESGGGGGDYIKGLRKIDSNPNISFLGPIYDINILNEHYRTASIFVYPSVAEKGETFGLAPLEAMAWGCVPIVSDLDCFKDFITHDVNGAIFNHRSSNATLELSGLINLLQRDADIRNKLASNAIKVQESHSTSVIANEFVRQFKESNYEKGI